MFSVFRTIAAVGLALATVPASAQSHRCVDLLAFERFYYWPELLGREDEAVVREAIRTHYPELPALIGLLRPEHAAAHNAAHVRRLKDESAKPVSYGTALAILQAVQANPVASLDALSKFDPTQKVGFCYGRAYAVLREAEGRGLDRTTFRKFFIIGDLVGRTQRWTFHSVQALPGENEEGFWAVDPLCDRPLLPSEWLRLWTKDLATDPEGTNLFFATGPDQLTRSPDMTIEKALASPIVGEYFRALIDGYDKR